jgi:DNA-binding response OmpR family regulator
MNDTKALLNVDDHAPTRFVRTRILERAGFRVDEADNAAEAMKRGPDASLLLLDVRLPDGDGFGVCEEVKKMAPAVPVVMITSVYRDPEARVEGLGRGADAFLLEPVAADQLVRTVDALIRRGAADPGAQAETSIVTDWVGTIIDLSDKASELLNLSRRGARGRKLTTFFIENRCELIREVQRASDGRVVEKTNTLQPRDRRVVRVHIEVSSLPNLPGDRIQLQWVLTPERN